MDQSANNQQGDPQIYMLHPPSIYSIHWPSFHPPYIFPYQIEIGTPVCTERPVQFKKNRQLKTIVQKFNNTIT